MTSMHNVSQAVVRWRKENKRCCDKKQLQSNHKLFVFQYITS